MSRRSSSYEEIYTVVRQVPSGKVATYGQIAALAGMPGAARQVGYALNALPGDGDVPWHRVINAQGKISLRTDGNHHIEQRSLLEEEGIEFNEDDRIDLQQFRWDP